MSRLEKEAKPILARMINPPVVRAVKLNHSDQRTVSYWAVEKALCLELSMRQSRRDYRRGYLTPDPFRWLYDHHAKREPPPGTRVFLFAFSPRTAPRARGLTASHLSVGVTNRAKDELAPCASFSTMTIGCLGLQVFIPDIVMEGAIPQKPDRFDPPRWLTHVLIPIWPKLKPTARWLANGPAGVVNLADLDRIMSWGTKFNSEGFNEEL